jgi:hypothetical protein
VFLFIVILLLLAAGFGVLGAVLKVALVLIFAGILSLVVLAVAVYYYARHRVRRFMRGVAEQQGQAQERSGTWEVRGGKRPPTPPGQLPT